MSESEVQLNADDIQEVDLETGEPITQEPAVEAQDAEAEVDWRQIDEELKARGAGFGLKDAPKNFLDLQRGMTKANEKAKQLAQKYEPFAPLVDYLRQHPQEAERVYATLNENMDSGGGMESAETMNAVRRALDPVQRELHETRQWRLQQEMQTEIQKLQGEFKDVFEFSDEVANDLLTDCIAQNDYNIRRVFLDKHAGDILSRARSKGKQETVEAIKKRNDGYTPVSGPIPVGPAEIPDFSKLSPAEQNAELEKTLDRIWADKKLQKQIVSEVSG